MKKLIDLNADCPDPSLKKFISRIGPLLLSPNSCKRLEEDPLEASESLEVLVNYLKKLIKSESNRSKSKMQSNNDDDFKDKVLNLLNKALEEAVLQ